MMIRVDSDEEIIMLQNDLVEPGKSRMPRVDYDNIASEVWSRIEILLRERDLRKSNKSTLLYEDGHVNGDVDLLRDGQIISEGDYRPHEEEFLDGSAVTRAISDGLERQEAKPAKQRIFVVANRLPVTAFRKDEDGWTLRSSAGGLVSAISGVSGFDTTWIGWAGVNVPDETGQRTLTKALAEKKCIPVFLDEEISHLYYNGYCNNILWPLFHYLGLPEEDRLATTRGLQSQFDAYKKANRMFADMVIKHFQDGDIVWCQDYHLMFLPKFLKEHNSEMKVGWFLHTPFPSSEILRTLPSRSELLRAVLSADLVGFHTYDYVRHFMSACTRILGLEGTTEGIEDQGKLTRVAAFPIGIDPDRFIHALELPQVKNHIEDFKKKFAGRKVILGVDRLDMIKGIPQKLLAFEKFLEENPSWKDKVVLLQIGVPTRTDVLKYQKLTSEVHEIVGRINGKSEISSTFPIIHLDRSLDFQELCALYAITDVALVTSIRDGMNLVSYEFVASQASEKGVLILSEFTGAAQSLGAGAILINPWDITEVASAIGQALNMQAEEREKRHRHNFMHVTTHTSQQWAATFISELNTAVVGTEQRTRQIPPLLPTGNAIERYIQSNNRLLILGFNAILTEPLDAPGRRVDQFKEMELQLHPDLKEPLKRLCDDPKTTIVVLSGSGRQVLSKNFGNYKMWLAAEHGMYVRPTSRKYWTITMPENLQIEWVDSVKHVFEYFTARTPGSYYEIRKASIVWSYKYADVEFGRLQAKDMLQHLCTSSISNAPVEVVQGGRSVEVRRVGVTKGAAIGKLVSEIIHHKNVKRPIDYVLCIGHFLPKDEDVYTYFEPVEPVPKKPHSANAVNGCTLYHSGGENCSWACCNNGTEPVSISDTKTSTNGIGNGGQSALHDSKAANEGPSVLVLGGDCYFSCAVGRNRSKARYLLGSSADVVPLLTRLSESG